MGGGPIGPWALPSSTPSSLDAFSWSAVFRRTMTPPMYWDLSRALGPHLPSLAEIAAEAFRERRDQGPSFSLGLPRSNLPSVLSTLLSLDLPAKRKIFVSYHHHRDQRYYDALAAMCDDCEFLQDNSLDRRVDSDDPEYQERRIREAYIKGTSVTVVLCGLETYQRKFVDWEIYATLLKEGALIGIQLDNASVNPANGGFLVPHRLHDNIQSCYALWKHWHELTADNLRVWIEQAVAKDKTLISNWRAKKLRNG